MPIEVPTNIDYLIPQLRMGLWDVDSTKYRYQDSWLRTSIISAIKYLQRWWKDRYYVDEATYTVSRNPDKEYEEPEPEVIDRRDERPIILMAQILIKSGVLENSSWSFGSWRDAEYAVSNISSKDAKEKGIDRDWNELLMFLKPPTKRLNTGTRITFDFGSDETK